MRITSCLLMFCLLLASSVYACTGMRLIAKDRSVVHGRTLEFGTFIESSIAVVPRNFQFQGNGTPYTSRYAAVGAILFDIPALMDGLNEKGLSVGTFYFPGFAGYASPSEDSSITTLSPIDFPNWILTRFATIEEVKEALSEVSIIPTVFKQWGNETPPFHYVVYDKSGNSIVIEPIDGELIVHDNPFGVITNSPTFDWHMTNLRNFLNLRAANVPPIQVDGVELAPFGQGSGMVGLPGDFTPPSRFVRAAIFSYTAIASNTSKEAVFQLFHILNQFDIPIGIAREIQGGIIHTDYTMITCVKEPASLNYYFKTYDDQTIKKVDLNQFDWSAKKIKLLSTSGTQKIQDISSQLK